MKQPGRCTSSFASTCRRQARHLFGNFEEKRPSSPTFRNFDVHSPRNSRIPQDDTVSGRRGEARWSVEVHAVDEIVSSRRRSLSTAVELSEPTTIESTESKLLYETWQPVGVLALQCEVFWTCSVNVSYVIYTLYRGAEIRGAISAKRDEDCFLKNIILYNRVRGYVSGRKRRNKRLERLSQRWFFLERWLKCHRTHSSLWRHQRHVTLLCHQEIWSPLPPAIRRP